MRIAHLSDPHLLSLSGARWLDFANKRWIGGINLLVKRGRHHRTEIFEAMVDDLNALGVDHVLCTGDITNLALEPEFRFARSHFERLALDPDHITVLPGNHDAYVDGGVAHFHDHFEPYFRPDEAWRGGEEVWPIVRVRGPVAIIGLSTGMHTPWFTAFGKVGRRQLDRLGEILRDPRLDASLRLVAIHHPPIGGNTKSRVRGLHDWAEFGAVLQEAGAELVLHGHEHRDLRNELGGPGGLAIPVRGIQSGTFDDGSRHALRARYRIYEISGSHSRPRVVGERLRVWQPESERFGDDALAAEDAPSVAPA
jgi:3',5'-cyclic AMP phosphodiesterase CpdA